MSQNTETISVGQELKRIREQRGWTLEAAAKVTRIRADQLELIEQDRLDEFPCQSYVRGFIRIYSKALGLNPDIVMSHVEKRPEAPRFADDDQTSVFLDVPVRPKELEAVVGLDDRAQEWGSKIIAGLVALVIIAIVVVIYSTTQNTSNSQLNFVRDVAISQDELPVIPREKLLTTPRAPDIDSSVVQAPRVVPPAAVLNVPSHTADQPKPETTRNGAQQQTHFPPAQPSTQTPAQQPEQLNVVRATVVRPPQNPRENLHQQNNSDQPQGNTTGFSTPSLPVPEHATSDFNTALQDPVGIRNSPLIASTSEDIQLMLPVQEIEIVNGRVVRVERARVNSVFPSEVTSTAPAQTSIDNSSQRSVSVLDENFEILEEVVLPEEEVTLTGERLDQYLQQATTIQNVNPQGPQHRNAPEQITRVNGVRGAVARAIPVNRQTETLQQIIPANRPNSTSVQFMTDEEETLPPPVVPIVVAASPVGPVVETDTVHQVSGGAEFLPSTTNGENILRLELNREAFVRVFVNDTASQPAVDEVLPAGSAASWLGRRFTVTIRPANAATFYLNGQRIDYSDRGSENITINFP